MAELNFDVIMAQLLTLASDGAMSKHAISAISQAIGVCATHVTATAKRDTLVAKFISQLGSGPVPMRSLSLLCLGEIGRQNDLSSHGNLIDAVTSEFSSDADEVKTAAAFALGNVTAGNLQRFVPNLLSKLRDAHEHLMLHALKVRHALAACAARVRLPTCRTRLPTPTLALPHPPSPVRPRTCALPHPPSRVHPPTCVHRVPHAIQELIGSGQSQLSVYVPDMLPPLIAFAEHDDESVRNIISECLGRLAAVSAAAVMPQITELLSHGSGHVRATMVHSLRFAVADLGAAPLPPVIASSLLPFLNTMSDGEVAVRRAALLALNCTAHNKPLAIRDLLPRLLPLLYTETVKRPELVHQVGRIPSTTASASRSRPHFYSIPPRQILPLPTLPIDSG